MNLPLKLQPRLHNAESKSSEAKGTRKFCMVNSQRRNKLCVSLSLLKVLSELISEAKIKNNSKLDLNMYI